MEEKPLKNVKEMMCARIIFVVYDPIKPDRVVIDALDEGIGYILLQLLRKEECICKKKECKCKWRVVWDNSTILNPG